jgi:hypothetical protein
MLSVEQIQVALDSLKAENRLLKRLVERRKQRLPEDEYKSHERPVFRVPELDAVLVGVEEEAEWLVTTYRL